MIVLRLNVFVVMVVFGFMGCSSNEEFPIAKEYPVIFTNSVKELSSSGVVLSANLIDKGRAEINDYGFILIENEIEYQLSLRNSIDLDVFEIAIQSDLKEDVEYFYKAYIITDQHQIYGNEISFLSQGSLPPVITDFSPKQGYDLTTVTIFGNNFSDFKGRNKVTINDFTCEVLTYSSDSLVIQTPNVSFFGDYNFSIEVANQFANSNDTFTIYGPKIESLSVNKASSGDYLTISGKNFTQNGDNLSITFNGVQSELLDYSENQVNLIIPVIGALFNDSNVELKLTNGLKSASTSFVFQKQWEEKSPPINFSYNYKHPSFSQNNEGYLLRDKTIRKYSVSSDSWSSLGESPEITTNGFFTVWNNRVFKFGGVTEYEQGKNYFWEYFPETNSWIQLNPMPFAPVEPTFFQKNNNIYIIDVNQEVWKYNFIDESFTKMNNFPVEHFKANGFIQDDNGYVVTYGQTFQYVEESDSWIERSANNFTFNPSSSYGPRIQKLSEQGHLEYNDEIYKYDGLNDRWLHVSTLPGCLFSVSASFETDDSIYLGQFGGTCSPYFYSYSK